MLKRSSYPNQAQYFDIQVAFPSMDELVSRAEKLTESCIHADQVLVSRNFVMSVARRGVDRKKYSETDLMMLGMLVDHIAKRRTKSIYSMENNSALH